MITVQDCYQQRFSKKENKKRNELWKVMCTRFFQKYITSSDIVYDIGAGYCEFINNIICQKKIAIDINPDTKKYAVKEVRVIQSTAINIPTRYYGSADIVFISNFLEHLDTKDEVIVVLTKVNKLLKSGGKLLVLQPNIDLVKERYWDFIDHKVALNVNSVLEALELAGFEIAEVIEKFIPYTTKSRLIRANPLLLNIYFRLPPLLRPFAGQSFFVATKK